MHLYVFVEIMQQDFNWGGVSVVSVMSNNFKCNFISYVNTFVVITLLLIQNVSIFGCRYNLLQGERTLNLSVFMSCFEF